MTGAGTFPVQIVFSQNSGVSKTIGCDLLVVACDPRGLPMQQTLAERSVFSRLTNFTFHTYALKVKVPVDPAQKPGFGIILKPPEGLADMKGQVYGFRNESAKQFTLAAANAMDENLVVVYRLWSDPSVDIPPGQDERELRDQLSALPWWPYGGDFQIMAKLATPYFDHFDLDGVRDGKPWEYFDLQGDNATVYVHASTCFESVLTCWQYLEMLFGPAGKRHGVTLPADKAARICVLGAGVSGVLVTKWLTDAGYTNLMVLERDPPQVEGNANIYGKTVSLSFDEPRPPQGASRYKGPTVCELGTCYMSPAYDDLEQQLRAWTGVEAPRGFERGGGETGDFRGIVVTDQTGKSLTQPFTTYIFDAARAHLRKGASDTEVKVAIAYAAAVYCDWQSGIMGGTLPMPPIMPDDPSMAQTYSQFLNDPQFDGLLHPLRVLDGILEYSYSIQGYGPLDTIPAFYGLVWISRRLIEGEFIDELEGKPMVTFWPGGWGEIWQKLSSGMNIHYGVTVTKITRDGVTAPSPVIGGGG